MRGKERFSARKKVSTLIIRFSAGHLKTPGLKPISKSLLLRWTEVQLPLLKQGASTKRTSTAGEDVLHSHS